MNVEKHQLHPIVEGKITQVRVLEPVTYQLGRRQPVRQVSFKTDPKSGDPVRHVHDPVCHVKVTEIVACQLIDEASDLDVLSEGFPSRIQFLQHWCERLGNARLDIVRQLETWVVRFALVSEDVPRIPGKMGGYVTSLAQACPGGDPGEAVTEAVEDEFTKAAKRRHGDIQAVEEEYARIRRLNERIRQLRTLGGRPDLPGHLARLEAVVDEVEDQLKVA